MTKPYMLLNILVAPNNAGENKWIMAISWHVP